MAIRIVEGLTGEEAEVIAEELARQSSTCKAKGCDRLVKGKGFCETHLRRYRRCGDILENVPIGTMGFIKRNNAKAKCSVEGCENLVKARGLCNAHYRRLLDHGDTLSHCPVHSKSIVCLVNGCNNHRDSFGLCKKHQQHFRRWLRKVSND